MAGWLRPGGVMSHQIDFSCPGGVPWNHHWAYGPFAWKLIRGNRPYYVNRVPLSEYLRLLDADAAGADWREAAEVILRLDCVGNPAHAREVYQAHLKRAQWMAGEGYRHLLQR